MAEKILEICAIILELILILLVFICIYKLHFDFCIEGVITTILSIIASIVGFFGIKEN